tara:strand:- start:8 stop:229 length:222 start_codon:yes stop_codon:yes gene_type:complete
MYEQQTRDIESRRGSEEDENTVAFIFMMQTRMEKEKRKEQTNWVMYLRKGKERQDNDKRRQEMRRMMMRGQIE